MLLVGCPLEKARQIARLLSEYSLRSKIYMVPFAEVQRHIMVDTPCVEPSLLMRRLIPHAGLVTFAACGHTPNIEEPGLFNLHVSEFLAAVDSGRWAGWSR